MNIDLIFEKLYNYYNVSSIKDLAKKMNISQPAISQWRSRNSISAIKKKCKELGIYDKIFTDDIYDSLKNTLDNYPLCVTYKEILEFLNEKDQIKFNAEISNILTNYIIKYKVIDKIDINSKNLFELIEDTRYIFLNNLIKMLKKLYNKIEDEKIDILKLTPVEAKQLFLNFIDEYQISILDKISSGMNETLLSKIKETLNNNLNEIDYINILHNLRHTLDLINKELSFFKSLKNYTTY